MSTKRGFGPDYAVDQVERDLLHGILAGRYRTGDLLPALERLCEVFGVGYLPVRAATARLIARGLLMGEPGVGLRVVDLQASMDLRLLIDIISEADDEPARRWTLLAQTCGFLRFILDEIVDRGAQHRNDEQLEWLRHLIRILTDRVDLKLDRSLIGECELQIWRVLAAASGCVTHTAVVNSMREFVVGDVLAEGSRPLIPIEDYWAIAEALAGRDGVRARELADASVLRLEEHCIDELKKLGWSETPSGASPG